MLIKHVPYPVPDESDALTLWEIHNKAKQYWTMEVERLTEMVKYGKKQCREAEKEAAHYEARLVRLRQEQKEKLAVAEVLMNLPKKSK